jgi:hypothetical protein
MRQVVTLGAGLAIAVVAMVAFGVGGKDGSAAVQVAAFVTWLALFLYFLKLLFAEIAERTKRPNLGPPMEVQGRQWPWYVLQAVTFCVVIVWVAETTNFQYGGAPAVVALGASFLVTGLVSFALFVAANLKSRHHRKPSGENGRLAGTSGTRRDLSQKPGRIRIGHDAG